jgi:hypothetical protein
MRELNAEEIKLLASAGASVVLPEDAPFTADQLKAMAYAFIEGSLTIKGARRYSADELRSIASALPGRIAFEL